MSRYDRNRIEHLEERLAESVVQSGDSSIAELEMLADLYMQADSYRPALETIDRLLSLTAARSLSPTRRAALESKAVECRLAQSDCHAAIARCREVLRDEVRIEIPRLRSRLYLQWGEGLFRLGRLDESREQTEMALAIADEAGDLQGSAASLGLLGRLAYREGDLLRARDLYEQELAIL